MSAAALLALFQRYSSLIIGVVIAAAAAYAVWWIDDNGYDRGAAKVQAKWDAEKSDIARQSFKLSEQNTRDTDTIKLAAAKLKGEKDAKIQKLDVALTDALERLRERPARDSGADMPGDPAAGASPGCTAAQLFREDANALVREAARADRLLADLAQCQGLYNKARDTLAGIAAPSGAASSPVKTDTLAPPQQP